MISAIPFVNSAFAQNVQKIAAIVNDDVVSLYDLRSRLRAVVISSGLRPTRKIQEKLGRQVLRTLIDERLQLQEAKNRNISVTRRDLNTAIAQLEKRNKIPAGKFGQFLARQGIPQAAIMEQIRAQIAWRKLVRRRLLPRITVGEEEVEDFLKRLKERKGEIEYHLSEILLSVGRPDQENEIMATANRLFDELKGGANFAAVAREFSQTASASSGGDMGWINEGALDSALKNIIPGLSTNGIARPIRSISGIHIYKLTGKRRILGGAPADAVVELQRLLLSVPEKSSSTGLRSQTLLAAIIGETLNGCSDMRSAAEEAGAVGKIRFGKHRVGNLSGKIRNAISDLDVGKASVPVRFRNGVAIFMVCSKVEAKSGLPEAKQIKQKLQEERLSVMSRRYMRDLRAAAVLDLRV
jgi:peptidyl-prolyl cis-trans isomerase SurA